MNFSSLPKPAKYFPLEKGIYEVAPGLRALGFDFGNDKLDKNVFQLDSDFQKYRENKILCRNERLSKYYCVADFSQEKRKVLSQFLLSQFIKEYPEYFYLELHPINTILHCKLTDEVLIFNSEFILIETIYSKKNVLSKFEPYLDAFDALCSQVQEDIAILSRKNKLDWLSALHLCAPSHWAAEDKIGKNFISVHAPVPHIEKLNSISPGIIEAMINKGPYVRFVWSFVTDKRLNHHPIAPAGHDSVKWKGRSFQLDNNEAPFHLRIERQVIYSFPPIESSLFGIRVSFISGNEIRENQKKRELLKSSLLSMSEASKVYKGVHHCFDELIQWLS